MFLDSLTNKEQKYLEDLFFQLKFAKDSSLKLIIQEEIDNFIIQFK